VVVSGCGHHGDSVNITSLTPVVGSFCIAPMMASCSALNIDNWSIILLRVDRLRPRILLFLPSFRCRSLCGRCIFRLPVLAIRHGDFIICFFSRFTGRPIHIFPIIGVPWRSDIAGSLLHFSSINVYLSEKFWRSYGRVLIIWVSLHSRRRCSGLLFVIW
jgi:hypothetical protein